MEEHRHRSPNYENSPAAVTAGGVGKPSKVLVGLFCLSALVLVVGLVCFYTGGFIGAQFGIVLLTVVAEILLFVAAMVWYFWLRTRLSRHPVNALILLSMLGLNVAVMYVIIVVHSD